jgi:hypothetical protein
MLRRHQVSAPFSPTDLTDLALWLKADAGINMGGLVTQIIITGFTGIYADANGTYDFNGDQYSNGSNFLIDNSGTYLFDDNTGQAIATNNNNSFGTWTPANFLSTIILSNAGTSSVNGVYTRTDTSVDVNYITFYASGGRIIARDGNDGDFWLTTNDEYRNNGNALGINDWVVETGDSPAPTAVNSSSPRNVGSPTSTTTIVNYVSEWVDQSESGNNALSTNYPTIVSNQLNGLPVIRNSAIGYFECANIEMTPDSTVIAVAKLSSTTSDYQRLVHWNAYEDAYGFFGCDSSQIFATFFGNGSWFDTDANTPNQSVLGSFNILGCVNSSGVATPYYNKTALNTKGGSTLTISGVRIFNGAAGGDGQFWQGDIAELIIYNRAITTLERQQVEAYLNTRYAIY